MNLIAQRIVLIATTASASILITACGARSANQSTESFTVYEDAPKVSLLDLGAPGNSLETSIIFLLRCIQNAAAR